MDGGSCLTSKGFDVMVSPPVNKSQGLTVNPAVAMLYDPSIACSV